MRVSALVSVFVAALLIDGSAMAMETQWKVDPDVTFAGLVKDGYRVVGYGVVGDPSPKMAYSQETYLLQRDTTVYACWERSNKQGYHTACGLLVAPPKP